MKTGVLGEDEVTGHGRDVRAVVDHLEPTDFEKAYERALQSRHVPEYERAFLARYFRILREGSR